MAFGNFDPLPEARLDPIFGQAFGNDETSIIARQQLALRGLYQEQLGGLDQRAQQVQQSIANDTAPDVATQRAAGPNFLQALGASILGPQATQRLSDQAIGVQQQNARLAAAAESERVRQEGFKRLRDQNAQQQLNRLASVKANIEGDLRKAEISAKSSIDAISAQASLKERERQSKVLDAQIARDSEFFGTEFGNRVENQIDSFTTGKMIVDTPDGIQQLDFEPEQAKFLMVSALRRAGNLGLSPAKLDQVRQDFEAAFKTASDAIAIDERAAEFERLRNDRSVRPLFQEDPDDPVSAENLIKRGINTVAPTLVDAIMTLNDFTGALSPKEAQFGRENATQFLQEELGPDRVSEMFSNTGQATKATIGHLESVGGRATLGGIKTGLNAALTSRRQSGADVRKELARIDGRDIFRNLRTESIQAVLDSEDTDGSILGIDLDFDEIRQLAQEELERRTLRPNFLDKFRDTVINASRPDEQ